MSDRKNSDTSSDGEPLLVEDVNVPDIMIGNVETKHSEKQIRQRLKQFFMNPFQKYKEEKTKPYKLILQIMKIVLLIAQVFLFGTYNLSISNFKTQNDLGFKTAFLSQKSVFYTKGDVYTQIEQIRRQYATWKNNTVGIFQYPPEMEGSNGMSDASPPVEMRVLSYDSLENASQLTNLTFNLDKQNWTYYKLQRWIKDGYSPIDDHVPLMNGTDYQFDFLRLIMIHLAFNFSILQINIPVGITPTTHYDTNVLITIDNSPHDGAITPSLTSEFHMTSCGEEKINAMNVFINCLDAIIILMCCISAVFCIHSLLEGQNLRRDVTDFLQVQRNETLCYSDKMKFFDMWYLLIIANDILTILGSTPKMILQNMDIQIVDHTVCTVFLGVGCLCLFVGILRYVGFFKKFNILILTLKIALPHVGRFMVCASLLYFGFMFCGWLVLGPYHTKFSTLYVTSETLFSLINGDDMFETFKAMSPESTGMVVFSQIYLYVFISLFIYAVLNLFIAVIMDTYECVKEHIEPKKTKLEEFIEFENDNDVVVDVVENPEVI